MSCVRPGVFEAKAKRPWRVNTLIVVDLPALERPANAISGTCISGKPRNSEADRRKRALSNKLKTILQEFFHMILKLQSYT